MNAEKESGSSRTWERFFSDDGGNLSSMRLMSFLSLVFSGVLAGASVWGDSESGSELVLYFLVGAFAPKAVQKFAEKS